MINEKTGKIILGVIVFFALLYFAGDAIYQIALFLMSLLCDLGRVC
jgi:hypothetical protein